MTRAPQLEIAVQDPAGARVAFAEGADRVELCQALEVGGLTPSAGIVQRVIEATGDAGAIAPLVRPRPGGFVYDADEAGVVAADIRYLVSLGVGAVVVGCLTVDGRVDAATLARWREAAGSASLVFHRAIDASADPLAALDVLMAEGVARVLTSGGASRTIDGADVLRTMVGRADGRIEIMAGGGVRPEDVAVLRDAGVDAVHLSARARSADAAPSGPGGGAGGFDVTDPAVVRAAADALRSGAVS
ncbi:copper homeostasis protein CutC [Microbacterium sp. KR10-403]|uniref:copper homeostasis protein CutC n=1 Tax=Microbacterium sp. KR10-403 TaxID=3158581 RepID=UPI0032E43658